MSLHVIQSGIVGGERIYPPTWQSDAPVPCSNPGCDVVMDADADSIEFVDGDPYCEECVDDARLTAYRDHIALELPGEIEECIEFLDRADETYSQIDESETGPYAMLSDVKNRIACKYEKGEDTGWRDGLMMSAEEADELLLALRKPEEFSLAQQLVKIEGFIKRTRYGAGVGF